jgi:O-antigen ligase
MRFTTASANDFAFSSRTKFDAITSVPSSSDHPPDQPGGRRRGHPRNTRRGRVNREQGHGVEESAVASFRGTGARRTKIHILEFATLWVISAHLCFLPWAFGGMRIWVQVVSLALSALSFLLALFPRYYTEEDTGSTSFRLIMWPKLIKFPIFWIGLALLGYVVLQALNPGWEYQINEKGAWYMRRIEARSWLPSGVIAPFEKWNQWRMLIIYAAGLLTICAMWVSFTRRRTLQFFLLALAVNGLLLAIFGLAQRMTKAAKIYWSVDSSNPQFFSSFIYKNHGAAYLDITLVITSGLASWYYLRGLRRLEKSNPSGVLAFFATFISVAVLLSYARGATVVMLVFLLGCIGSFLIHQFILPKENRRPVIAITLVLIFGYFLKTGLEALRSGEAWDRLRQGVMREDLSLEVRERVTAASKEMLRENLSRGIGAGSFRFIFPIYQYRHPELVSESGVKLFWEHAHNDVLQFPIELGITGIVVIGLASCYWIYALIKAYFWENPMSACIVFGAVLLLVYAWWDFPLQCPAVLLTWCVMWAAATMWARFEEGGVKS